MAADPNIKKKAQDIRYSKKGSEVRESLASGLESMSEDVVDNTGRQDAVEKQFQDVLDETTDKDFHSAPEIKAARNGKPNLKTRIDDFENQTTAQLAHITLDVKNFGAVGDGITDDTQSIQDALNRAGQLKCKVTIPPSPSEYIFTRLHVPSHVTFTSSGGVLKYKSNTARDSAAKYYLIENLNESNTIFDGLIIDGNGENNQKFQVADVITCVGENSITRNCYVMNAPDSGIMFSATKNGLCVKNRVDKCSDVGIYVNGGFADKIEGAIISENIITNSRQGGIALKRESTHVSVVGNYISDCGNGITLEESDNADEGYPKYINIANNKLNRIGYMYNRSEVAERGISVTRTEHTTIIDNDIVDVSGAGLICVQPVRNVVIKGNTIKNYKSNPRESSGSIYIAEMIDSVVSGNLVRASNSRALYVLKATNSQITNNNLMSSDSVALRLNSDIIDSVITGNVLTGNTRAAELYPFKSVYKDNIDNNSSGLNKMGIRTIPSGQPLPNVDYSPRYAGEIIVHLLEKTWWIANSFSDGDWSQISN